MTAADKVAVSITSAGVRFDIRVIPRAPRTEIKQVRDGRLLVRVTAPPVDQAANAAVIAALSHALRLPAKSLRIAAGETSRNKSIEATGVDAVTLAQRIALLTGGH